MTINVVYCLCDNRYYSGRFGEEAAAEIERLRSALLWYADPKTWLPDFGHDGESPATMDAGEHARNALVEVTHD